MTLCTAWIRKNKYNLDELVFATDSCLSGGERWNSGVKLFELPRKDCLICFAGETNRTYPLILNLISSIRFDEGLSNPHTDISEILDYITNLFTSLCESISDYGTQTFEEALGDFEFMFGGWSWKDNKLKIFKIKYNSIARGFLHETIGENNMTFAFIGDEVERAEELLATKIKNKSNAFIRDFDMEPFSVLLNMIRDPRNDSIKGAIQLAKIHPPGISEFYGVYWPSIEGNKTFLGKNVSLDNNPNVKFIDPDTCEIIDEELPISIDEPTKEIYGVYFDFIKYCYSEEGSRLKESLNKNDSQKLVSIFKDIAYRRFLKENNNDNIIDDEYIS